MLGSSKSTVSWSGTSRVSFSFRKVALEEDHGGGSTTAQHQNRGHGADDDHLHRQLLLARSAFGVLTLGGVAGRGFLDLVLGHVRGSLESIPSVCGRHG